MIGIFDSGIGGLTVAKEIKKAIPNCPIVYFGDTARYPWGNKSAELVRKYSLEITDFLIKQGARNIVIACNTASTFAGDYLKKKFPEINFYDVISPVIRRILFENNAGKNFKVGVIGTQGTIGSKIYENKIKKGSDKIKVLSKACPLFAPIAEEGLGDHKLAEAAAENYLGEWKNKKLDALVLGCTHYPLLKNAIKKTLGNIIFISSAEEIAKELKNNFKNSGDENIKDIYYFSDLTDNYKKIASDIIGKKIKINKANGIAHLS